MSIASGEHFWFLAVSESLLSLPAPSPRHPPTRSLAQIVFARRLAPSSLQCQRGPSCRTCGGADQGTKLACWPSRRVHSNHNYTAQSRSRMPMGVLTIKGSRSGPPLTCYCCISPVVASPTLLLKHPEVLSMAWPRQTLLLLFQDGMLLFTSQQLFAEAHAPFRHCILITGKDVDTMHLHQRLQKRA